MVKFSPKVPFGVPLDSLIDSHFGSLTNHLFGSLFNRPPDNRVSSPSDSLIDSLINIPSDNLWLQDVPCLENATFVGLMDLTIA